jgi:hypothetical protein
LGCSYGLLYRINIRMYTAKLIINWVIWVGNSFIWQIQTHRIELKTMGKIGVNVNTVSLLLFAY